MPATRTQRQRRKAPTPIEIPTTPAASSAAVTPTDAPETHIKRPSNCFILFRSAHHADVKATHASNRENELSGILSQMWTDAPESEKNIWREAAKTLAQKHKEMYPDYTFQPQRKQKLEDADQQASDENAADLVKPKAAAKKRSTRAPRGRKAAAQAAAPALEPTQAAAPSRTSTRCTRNVRTSTAAPSAPGAGPSRLAAGGGSVLLASGASPLPHSDVESTATVFLPAPVSGYPQPMAPSFPASLDANAVSTPAQRLPWSQVSSGDGLPAPAAASPSLSKGFDLRHLSREWVGQPPRFIDPAFPAHLPIAGSVGPIDLEDALFALKCVQSGIGEAWVAPPPHMVVSVDISSPGFSSAPYDYPTPNGDDMLVPAMNEHAVHHAMDRTAVNVAPSCTFEYVLDSVSQELAAFVEQHPHQPPSPYETKPVDYAPAPPGFTITDSSQLSAGSEADPQRFGDTFKELDELLQSIGIPMDSMESSL